MVSYARLALALSIASLISLQGAYADELRGSMKEMPHSHTTHLPEKLDWKTGPESLPQGAKMVALKGDMKKAELFAVRFQFPAGYKIPPHFHPADENITVISGAFYLGAQETFSEDAAEVLPVGAFSSMPAGMKHFAFTKENTVIQLNGQGPWGITYLNPADDPRKKN